MNDFKLADGTPIREAIPGVADVAYFQTSGLSLKLQPVLDTAIEWMQFQARGPARAKVVDSISQKCEDVRGKVAWALGADEEEIALVENATVGINIVASGIDWKPVGTMFSGLSVLTRIGSSQHCPRFRRWF